MTTTKYDFKEMQDFLLEATKKESRLRSKISFVFGKLYFEPIPDAEFEK